MITSETTQSELNIIMKGKTFCELRVGFLSSHLKVPRICVTVKWMNILLNRCVK